MLTSSVKGHGKPIYSAVIDRMDQSMATVLIEEIDVQCTIPVTKFLNMSKSLEQNWIKVTYNERKDTCEFIAIDHIKTDLRKRRIIELQNNLKDK